MRLLASAGQMLTSLMCPTDCFWVNPFGMSFDQITASDLLLVGPDGKVVEGTGKPGNTVYNQVCKSTGPESALTC
jgi:ribulose-5-phosphate 4-epimerase/fuculose-1-phosphate aldolase